MTHSSDCAVNNMPALPAGPVPSFAEVEALRTTNEELGKKVSHYAEMLDKANGTPCEQIRHAQEVGDLQYKLNRAQELEGLTIGDYVDMNADNERMIEELTTANAEIARLKAKFRELGA